VRGEDQGMTANRDAFFRAIQSWNSGDLDAYLELYDDTIQLHGYAPEPMSKEEVAGFYKGLWAALSDPKIEVHQVLEDGDKLAAQATMSATHTGELAGVPGTGNAVAQPVMTIVRFNSNHKVVERWSLADMVPVLQQIGVIPS
jgi:steroid delta-isomerase-like uncharacterized protein